MAGFEVLPEQVAGLSADVDAAAEQLRAQVAALEADVDDVLAVAWRGAAAGGFARSWDEWRTGARDVLSALEAMAELLGATAADYRRAEAASVLTR